MAGKYWYTDSDGKKKRTPEGVRHEYAKFQSSKQAKKDRAVRNRLRRHAIREGKVEKGDRGHEVDHIIGMREGGGNEKENLRIVSRSFNRGRRQSSRRKGSRRNRIKWGL